MAKLHFRAYVTLVPSSGFDCSASAMDQALLISRIDVRRPTYFSNPLGSREAKHMTFRRAMLRVIILGGLGGLIHWIFWPIHWIFSIFGWIGWILAVLAGFIQWISFPIHRNILKIITLDTASQSEWVNDSFPGTLLDEDLFAIKTMHTVAAYTGERKGGAGSATPPANHR